MSNFDALLEFLTRGDVAAFSSLAFGTAMLLLSYWTQMQKASSDFTEVGLSVLSGLIAGFFIPASLIVTIPGTFLFLLMLLLLDKIYHE